MRSRKIEVSGLQYTWSFGGYNVIIHDLQSDKKFNYSVVDVMFGNTGFLRDLEKKSWSLKPGHVKMFICKVLQKCDHEHHDFQPGSSNPTGEKS